MNAIDLFRRFAANIHIAHHLPGRIRLKLSPVELDDDERAALAEARAFREALDNIPGVTSIRLNLLARSCTVDYDRDIIPPAAWSDLLGNIDSPAARVLLDILITRYTEALRA